MSGRSSRVTGSNRSHIKANLQQALTVLEAFDYATDEVMVDAWRLVHKLLDEAQTQVRAALTEFLSAEADKAAAS